MKSTFRRLIHIIFILEKSKKGKKNILIIILLSSVLIPIIVNVLFQSEEIIRFMENKLYFVIVGLLIYSIWLGFLFFLFKKDCLQFKDFTITREKLVSGILSGFYLFVGSNILLVFFLILNDKEIIISKNFSSIDLAAKVSVIFVFNILIGAFIEEIIFRAYLIPQIFTRIKKKFNSSIVSLIITVLVTQFFFATVHAPRDILRYNLDFYSVLNRALPLFESGIIMSLVFLFTRNVFFVTIFHAFCNLDLSLFDSPYFKSYMTTAAVVIAIFWYKIIEPKNIKVFNLKNENEVDVADKHK